MNPRGDVSTSNPIPSHPAHNRTFALYLEVKARFEPITYPKTTINTDQPLEQCIAAGSGCPNCGMKYPMSVNSV